MTVKDLVQVVNKYEYICIHDRDGICFNDCVIKLYIDEELLNKEIKEIISSYDDKYFGVSFLKIYI